MMRSAVLASLLLLALPAPPVPAQEAQAAPPLSDEALEAALRAGPQPAGFHGDGPLDAALLALEGRDPQRWTPILAALLAAHREAGGDLALYYLTALRRMQGRPDPLTVEAVELSEGPYLYPELPVLGVRLLHTVGETEAYTLTIGGDYRGGRLGRWDVTLRDAEGAPHAGRDDWVSAMGGGMYTRQTVGPGFAWGVEVPSEWDRISAQLDGREVGPVEVLPVPLAVADYVRPTSLGAFEATAHYHDHAAIADRAGPAGTYAFRSPPVRFEWLPRAVRLEPEREARIRALARELVDASPVLVTDFHLTTGYVGDAEAEHPLERLFAEGWAAVPVLVELLEASADPLHRAWWLVALYDLTGLESPAGFQAGRAIGSHHTLGRRMPAGSGVGSTAPYGKSTRPAPTFEAQEPFVAAWRRHLAHFRVERGE